MTGIGIGPCLALLIAYAVCAAPGHIMRWAERSLGATIDGWRG